MGNHILVVDNLDYSELVNESLTSRCILGAKGINPDFYKGINKTTRLVMQNVYVGRRELFDITERIVEDILGMDKQIPFVGYYPVTTNFKLISKWTEEFIKRTEILDRTEFYIRSFEPKVIYEKILPFISQTII